MKIIDLYDEHRALFATCLEDWSDDVREAGDRCARWVDRTLAKGLRAKLTVERARRAASELGDKVLYREIDTSEPADLARWGFSDALFVDGKEIRAGPPPSYEKVRSIIAKRVNKLR